MKNLNCPECDISRYQVRNEHGQWVVVTVNDLYEILPVHPDDSLEGFDLTIIYCLGCSWSGSPKSLSGGKHKKKY